MAQVVVLAASGRLNVAQEALAAWRQVVNRSRHIEHVIRIMRRSTIAAAMRTWRVSNAARKARARGALRAAAALDRVAAGELPASLTKCQMGLRAIRQHSWPTGDRRRSWHRWALYIATCRSRGRAARTLNVALSQATSRWRALTLTGSFCLWRRAVAVEITRKLDSAAASQTVQGYDLSNLSAVLKRGDFHICGLGPVNKSGSLLY